MSENEAAGEYVRHVILCYGVVDYFHLNPGQVMIALGQALPFFHMIIYCPSSNLVVIASL